MHISSNKEAWTGSLLFAPSALFPPLWEFTLSPFKTPGWFYQPIRNITLAPAVDAPQFLGGSGFPHLPPSLRLEDDDVQPPFKFVCIPFLHRVLTFLLLVNRTFYSFSAQHLLRVFLQKRPSPLVPLAYNCILLGGCPFFTARLLQYENPPNSFKQPPLPAGRPPPPFVLALRLYFVSQGVSLLRFQW